MKELTAKILLRELKERIKSGEIRIDQDSYEHGVGLSCQNYEFRFPDGWDHPQCYRVVADLNGEKINDKEWGQKTKKKVPKQ